MNPQEEAHKRLKEECDKFGCFCPESHIAHHEVANTPLWLRVYFELVGKIKMERKIDSLESQIEYDLKN